MKSNIFKYVFIIFVIGIIIFAVVKIKSDDKNQEEKIYQAEDEIEEINTELKLGIASFDSMNPILSTNKNVQDISKIMYDSLLTLTKDYKLEYLLAKEWAKQGAKTYLIKLQDDIKWSDGTAFTSKDVKFTIDKLKSKRSIYSENVKNIKRLEIVDDTTIKITLNKEVPFFEYNLVFPILSQKYYSNKKFNKDIIPIGTGMYKATGVKQSSIIFEKNNYNKLKDDLKINKITVTLYESIGELYNAFKTGSIDMVSTQNSNLKEYIGTIGYTAKEIKGREHDFIAFNTNNEILKNTKVRKAICYSIDKSNIVSKIYKDKYYKSNFPLDYGNWIYPDKNLETDYGIKKAKQLLSDDGWNYQYGSWQKNVNYRTQRISLNFVVKSSDKIRVKVAENIKNQLEKQGFVINIIYASNSQYNSYIKNRNYDMILCSMNLSIRPDLSTFFGNNNLAKYNNNNAKNILKEVKNLSDETKLKEDYKKLAEIYIKECPYLSLYNNKFITAYNSNLSGTLEPNWFNQFYNMKDWHR